MAGRPTILNDALEAALLKRISDGCPFEIAAESEGIGRRTIYQWIEQGEADPTSRYAQFSQAAMAARAEYRQKLLREISEAHAPGQTPLPDWRARAWVLERTSREDFGLQVDLRVQRQLEIAVERLRAGLDPETFGRVLRLLVGAGGGDGDGAAADADDGGHEPGSVRAH